VGRGKSGTKGKKGKWSRNGFNADKLNGRRRVCVLDEITSSAFRSTQRCSLLFSHKQRLWLSVSYLPYFWISFRRKDFNSYLFTAIECFWRSFYTGVLNACIAFDMCFLNNFRDSISRRTRLHQIKLSSIRAANRLTLLLKVTIYFIASIFSILHEEICILRKCSKFIQ